METPPHHAAWLEWPDGKQTPILGTCSIGRGATNSVVLAEDKVSRRHAMIHAQGQDEFWIIDLGSSNGTYLNGRRVSQPSQLTDRDQVKVGDQAFTFRYPKMPRSPEADRSGAEKTIQEIKSLPCWLLVADIESSTQLTHKLPPEEASRVTGRWLAECKQIIDDHGGAINKFLGDGFFAYWIDRADAAASVAQALGILKQQQEQAAPRFRLALHYGKVFVGGAASMGEESLLGNEVNFVFRMEKLAGALGAPSLLSEPAHAKLKPILPATEEGRHRVQSFDGEFLFFRL